MRETCETPTIALSSFKANWLVLKSWGIHIKDTHSDCVFHFILDLVVSCVTSLYPCETRMNGQVKLKRRKMATRVQVRPLSGRKCSMLRGATSHFIQSPYQQAPRHHPGAHLSNCNTTSVQSG